MIRHRKPKTAAEFVAELNADPGFVARKGAFDAKRQQESQQHQLTAQPVLEELRQAGFVVESLDQLRHSGAAYKGAIPVLLRWLPLVPNEDVKESIVRALSVPFAKPVAARPLIVEFLRAGESSSGLKWAIGNALEVVADESVLDDLCELALDRRHDIARQMIVLRLGKSKNPRVVDVLIQLLDDDQVSGHAVSALGRLRAQKARPHLERFLTDWRSWVRKKAAKALAKLDK